MRKGVMVHSSASSREQRTSACNARRLIHVGSVECDSESQDDHDRWFDGLLSMLRRGDRSRSEDWQRAMDGAPRLDVLEPGELSEMMCDAESATDDDVPWRFPVRTPLEDQR